MQEVLIGTPSRSVRPVYTAPMASGGSDSRMAEEIVFQKSGAVKANG